MDQMPVNFVSWAFPFATLITLIIFVIKSMRENDSKINRVYQRLDEAKMAHEKKYVYKDICNVVHERLTNDIGEIKNDVKELLKKKGD